MHIKHKILIIQMLILTSIVLLFSINPLAFAEYDPNKPLGDACTGDAASSEICKASNKDPVGKEGVIYKVAILISYFAGSIGIIMLIYSGFMYVTANGDANKITKARQTIVYVVVGLFVIVIAAQLVAFIYSKAGT